MSCCQKAPVQTRHEELKVKARLLLEKAQRESVDLKHVQRCDETANHHPDHQQPQQPQVHSTDNTVTAAADSILSSGAG